jgi:hypothetical protein
MREAGRSPDYLQFGLCGSSLLAYTKPNLSSGLHCEITQPSTQQVEISAMFIAFFCYRVSECKLITWLILISVILKLSDVQLSRLVISRVYFFVHFFLFAF